MKVRLLDTWEEEETGNVSWWGEYSIDLSDKDVVEECRV
jgi:hypothetical protein